MPETETIFAEEVFDTHAEVEAYLKGIQSMMDYALEYSSDYTFRWEVTDHSNHYSVVVIKSQEEY